MDHFEPVDLFGTSPESSEGDVSAPIIEKEPIQAPAEETPPPSQEALQEPAPEETAGAGEEAPQAGGEAQEEKEPADAPTSPQFPSNTAVLEAIAQVSAQLDGLAKQFDASIKYNAGQDKVIDQMHGELKKYRDDLYAQLIRPILLDIIEVRDSILRMAATYRAKSEGEQSIPNKVFSDYARYDLQDILEKNNVEIHQSEVGDVFDPARQKGVRRIATDNEALHGAIAELVSCGYSYGSRMIVPEKVAVYYYEPPKEPETAPAQSAPEATTEEKKEEEVEHG